mmetsp:Transcript_104867/g.262684  ORF Transcript_104867/g.262684 Transcript_104867/m.262684 type:complete len:243 (-) Transcript_104867:699-1427(-)
MTRRVYSSRAAKNAFNLARFSAPSAAELTVRTRCTSFSAVFGGRSPRSASTALAVAGGSGANGRPSSPSPLFAVTSRLAASAAERSCGQPWPWRSSSSTSSPSSSSPLSPLSPPSSPSSSSSSPSPPSSVLPSSSPSPSALRLGREMPSSRPSSSSSSSPSPVAASASKPSARATRARSRASNFSAFSRANSSGVFKRSEAIAFRSVPSFRTSWSNSSGFSLSARSCSRFGALNWSSPKMSE